IGPDEETATILELSKLVANETGYNGNPIFVKDRPKEVKFASCSSDKARKLLGYETKTSLKESIKLTTDFVRQRGIKKFDYNLPAEALHNGQAFRFNTIQDRPIWIAASTHQNEEEQILNAHKKILQVVNDMLLILVPRHPERFNKVKQLLNLQGYNFTSRTEYKSVPENNEIFLGDTMGELLLFYAASDVAFVGGSMVPIGGHNLFEPASLGLPIITGKHMFSQKDMTDLFIKRNAVDIVSNENELASKVIYYIQNKQYRLKQGGKARGVVSKKRGALSSLMTRIDDLLNE
ncbi:MAG: hypothetical protein HN886_07780, partial [Woeseiaceae bacterium]|nr:hypothetical protein [Woeseiaceae bacterium]